MKMNKTSPANNRRKSRSSSASTAALPESEVSLISDQEIYDRIVSSIMEHRLLPGTKLGEDKLGKIFGVGRTRIRPVLARLAVERIVTLQPNRGAFVAKPSIDEAREVLELRRQIEALVVRRVSRSITPPAIERLRAHVDAEAQARAAQDRRAMIRLSGEYHTLLADLSGNALAAKWMRELASLTCLIILLYDVPAVPSCRNYEHEKITQALAEGNESEAARLMDEHLEHLEACLDLYHIHPDELDLESALAQ
jgi:DNA-binding GntR family transcriptional regulator